MLILTAHLPDVSYDGPLLEEKALLTAAEGGLSSPEYVDLCKWLASRLKPLCELEESITSGSGLRHHAHRDYDAHKPCFCTVDIQVRHVCRRHSDQFLIDLEIKHTTKGKK